MNGLIRLGAYISPPDVEPCILKNLSLSPTIGCVEPGIVSQFLAMTLQYAKIDYEITSASRQLGVLPPNSSQWTGLFGELQRGEIDLITTFASLTQIRSEHFDYTRFFDAVHYVFLIKRDSVTLSQGTRMLINGFSRELWVAVVVTLITLALSLILAKWVHSTPNSASQNRGRHFLESVTNVSSRTIRFVLHQFYSAGDFKRTSLSLNSLFVFLSLFSVVIASLYEYVIYSQAKLIARNPPFRSTEDLVHLIKTRRLTLITSAPDMAYFDGVNHANNSHYKMVREALSKNPLKHVHNSTEALNLLTSNDGYVYVSLRYAAMRMAQNNCDLAIVDVGTPALFTGFILSKNCSFRMKHKLDAATGIVRGRLEFLRAQMEKRYLRKCVGRNDVRELSLDTFSGVFILFLAIAGVSMLLFLAEVLLWCGTGGLHEERGNSIEIAPSCSRVGDATRR